MIKGPTMGILWKQSYETGIQRIDDQHRVLIRRCDEAYTAMITKNHEDWNEMSSVLDELRAYTVYHFMCEENLMTRYAYGDIESHVEEHEGFKARLAQLDVAIRETGNRDAVLDMIEYLISWISQHIMITDKGYVQDFKNKNINMEDLKCIGEELAP